MNVGAKSDAGSSAWEQLAATPSHEHPIRQQQPTAPPPVVKQTSDAKPPEYGEELHPELVSGFFAFSPQFTGFNGCFCST